MAAPIGNQNAKGSKGGGRPSAYTEKARAEMLWDVWDGKYTKEEIEKIVNSGKFGAYHKVIEKAMEGNTMILTTLIKKLFPDRLKAEVDTGEQIRELQKLMGTDKEESEKT